MSSSIPHQLLHFWLLPAFCLSACGVVSGPAPTPTLVPTPTDTPIPMAVTINGEGIPATEFEAELARYHQAQTGPGNSVDQDAASEIVMNDIIDSVLLAQGAAASGLQVDDATVQGRLDNLATQLGGLDGLRTWESNHGYSENEFRNALRREVAAAWMRDQIAASIPPSAEQVHVMQILLYNAVDAQKALGYLQAGWDFTDLAGKYDLLTKGELGWFPRGYISSPAIEEAAFALQPGETSAIIEDETGYHILYLVERDPARQLSADALLTLQEHAVQNWLAEKWNDSTILFAP